MSYQPRKGTVAHALIEHLQQLPEGTQLTVPEIAAQHGIREDSVIVVLRAAATAGLLDFVKVAADGKSVRAYRLPQAVDLDTEAARPLEINHDSTGDLWFSGARQTADGSTLLSQEQLQQLVDYATTPPVKLPRPTQEAQS